MAELFGNLNIITPMGNYNAYELNGVQICEKERWVKVEQESDAQKSFVSDDYESMDDVLTTDSEILSNADNCLKISGSEDEVENATSCWFAEIIFRIKEPCSANYSFIAAVGLQKAKRAFSMFSTSRTRKARRRLWFMGSSQIHRDKWEIVTIHAWRLSRKCNGISDSSLLLCSVSNELFSNRTRMWNNEQQRFYCAGMVEFLQYWRVLSVGTVQRDGACQGIRRESYFWKALGRWALFSCDDASFHSRQCDTLVRLRCRRALLK